MRFIRQLFGPACERGATGDVGGDFAENQSHDGNALSDSSGLDSRSKREKNRHAERACFSIKRSTQQLTAGTTVEQENCRTHEKVI